MQSLSRWGDTAVAGGVDPALIAGLKEAMGAAHVSEIEPSGRITIEDFDNLGLAAPLRQFRLTRKTQAELLNPPVDKEEEKFDPRLHHTFKGRMKWPKNQRA